jgi:hypothetical protein
MADSHQGVHRHAVSYIDKSREFYAAHGYEAAYRWATNDDAPFTPLTKPLSDCRVAVVTTAYLERPADPAPEATPVLVEATKEPYAAASDPGPQSMFTEDLSWDKEATHTDDVETFLPLNALRHQVEAGRIASVSPRFYGVPTEYSQRRTKADSEIITEWIRADEVDLMVLVPL